MSRTALLVVVAAALALPASAAAAPGALSQPGGASKCVSETGDGGACADGVGLVEPRGIAVSPDGRNVYVASHFGRSVAVFDRDADTGALTETGCVTISGQGNGCAEYDWILLEPLGIAVSPDGLSVYVAGSGGGFQDQLTIFRRDPATGAIAPPADQPCVSSDAPPYCPASAGPARALFGATDVALGPEAGGQDVYVASRTEDGVAEFKRTAATSKVTQPAGQSGCISNDGTAHNSAGAPADCRSMLGDYAFHQPIAIAVTPDGASVLTPAFVSDGLYSFARAASGSLTKSHCLREVVSDNCGQAHGIKAPTDVAVTPDSSGVYVASSSPGGVAGFSRAPGGALTQPSAITSSNPPKTRFACLTNDGSDSCLQGRSVGGATSVVVSPDGENVYLAAPGNGSVAAFARDSATNELKQLAGADGCLTEDGSGGLCAEGDLLDGISALAISPDGRFVYAASSGRNAVLVLRRERPAGGPGGGDGGPGGGSGDGAPGGGAGAGAPVVSAFSFSPRRFAVGRGRTARTARRRGATVRWTLSEPAAARIAIARVMRGRRSGTACVKPSPRLRQRQRCRRYGKRRHLARASTAGANTLRFSGRIGRRALRPGRYRATLVATDAAGSRSAPRRTRFRVVRR